MRRCLGCNTPIARGSRCANCKTQRGGSGWNWGRTRERVFARDGGCVMAPPHGEGDDALFELDHIVPRSQGGSDLDHNLRTLCRLHHRERTYGPRRRR